MKAACRVWDDVIVAGEKHHLAHKNQLDEDYCQDLSCACKNLYSDNLKDGLKQEDVSTDVDEVCQTHTAAVTMDGESIRRSVVKKT